ncbi:hypothetical protein B0A52_04095 [Exophiala mesophila]|uniref:Alpha/beta hydrolase fold-3 domain-containing protein n=1 Tax=Exophiala mesophila TaxID=212818 RepID=A0A438NA87_EXOME|nr:hypothetical protein B0A52_04095 [Exophiala mesophila]
MYYREIIRHGVRGLWIVDDPIAEPDVIIYYAHGGGFSMGSAYFYLEFLMAWATRLKESGFQNPAVFALEYTLVPDAKWPTQFNEARSGYTFLRETFGEDSTTNICVSGDSAGATIMLSMLLQLGHVEQDAQLKAAYRPGLAVLLSPWTHLVSELNQNTPSDYLDRNSLQLYAKQYAGDATTDSETISPGLSTGRWKLCSPMNGYRVIYGGEEVFAPGVHQMIHHIKDTGAVVKAHQLEGGIHAWPVVNLFLGATREERLLGLDLMTDYVVQSGMASKIRKTTPTPMPVVSS